MQTFLPGPGPLNPVQHHPDEAAAVPADAWAFVATSRVVRAYRGSYSLNATAADAAVIPDTWTPTITARATLSYKAPLPRNVSVFDPATNTFADWTPNPTQSRPVPGYSSKRSQATPPADFAVALDAWAQTTFGRTTPYYQGARAITVSVWDPATNTFADWTPAALLSRAIKAYSPPNPAQPRVAWGTSIITDQIAPLAQSRPSLLYRAPPAQVRTVAGLSIVTDAFAAPALSRSVPLFRSPAAFIASVFDQPPTVFGSELAPTALSRSVPNYRGSYSAVQGAADAEIPVLQDWTPTIVSRPSAFYAAVRPRWVSAYNPNFFGTAYAPFTQSAHRLYPPVRRITRFIYAFDGPSGVIPVEPVIPPDAFRPSAGGGGLFQLFKDPFEDPFSQPFKTPFWNKVGKRQR